MWSATTATPPSGLKPAGGVQSGSRTTLRTPGTASAFESSTRFGRPPDDGRPQDDGGQHPRQAHVGAVARLAGHERGAVDERQRSVALHELGVRPELHALGVRNRQRGRGLGQLAEARLLAGRGIVDRVVVHDQTVGRDAPARGGGGDEHAAGRGARERASPRRSRRMRGIHQVAVFEGGGQGSGEVAHGFHSRKKEKGDSPEFRKTGEIRDSPLFATFATVPFFGLFRYMYMPPLTARTWPVM